jgi:small GTP-binding protein
MAAPSNYKFIVIGSSGVGKTCLLQRLIKGIFDENTSTTVGAKFESLPLTIDDRKLKLQIWDTAGQERYHSTSKTYYRNAVGVALVFDITDRVSFESLSTWLTDVHSLCDPNAVIQLIGNKCDRQSERTVTILEAEGFARGHQMAYIETSAQSGENVREAFVGLATEIVSRGLKKIQGPGNPRPPAPIPLAEPPKKKCC